MIDPDFADRAAVAIHPAIDLHPADGEHRPEAGIRAGLGAHVANGSYMVAPEARGKGIGRQIGQFSIDEAKRLGFAAMQFNFVVKSNEKAVRLWRSLSFDIRVVRREISRESGYKRISGKYGPERKLLSKI